MRLYIEAKTSRGLGTLRTGLQLHIKMKMMSRLN